VPPDDLGAEDVDVDVDAPLDEFGAGDVDVPPGDAGLPTCSGGRYDPSSDLCWQDPPDEVWRNWDGAVAYCNGLSLGGHGPGSWHLLKIDELRSLVRGCPDIETGGACRVTEACPTDACWDSGVCNPPECDDFGGPGADGRYWPEGLAGAGSGYWSSSSRVGRASYAWVVNFYHGYAGYYSKTNADYLRRVRRGP
jgi:hypothetical protein